MQLSQKLAGLLPAPFKNLFGPTPKLTESFIPGSVEYVDLGGLHFAIGIEQCKSLTSPLKGNIHHLSTDPKAYYAAMGREENGSIDYSLSNVIQKLREILLRALELHEDQHLMFDKMAQLRGSPLEILIRDLAECANELADIPYVLTGHVPATDLPIDFLHCMRWVQSNMTGWRLQAYMAAERPLYWLLDYHRFGPKVYSRSGTTENTVGVACDEAVWVPDEASFERIEQLASVHAGSRIDVSLQFLDQTLSEYNAYLKQQVFRVTIRQVVTGDQNRAYDEIHSSEPCYGYQAATQQKEVSIRTMRHLNPN